MSATVEISHWHQRTRRAAVEREREKALLLAKLENFELNDRVNFFRIMLLTVLAGLSVAAAEDEKTNDLQWVPFPNPKLQVSGLPWFKENTPDLWRLPKSAKGKVPTAAWNRAIVPDGARIRFSCDTSRLTLKVKVGENKKPCFFDVYENGEQIGSARAVHSQEQTVTLFSGKKRQQKDIVIYLPNNQETHLLSVGLDSDANLKSPSSRFALDKPIVCYGSSVIQSTGAAHPSKTYPAILARQLNLDFVNLGFGGAGKAEPEIVALVNQLDASCFIFDLGKSYGDQPIEPYAHMLDVIRASHPKTPIFCVTPIYSLKEAKDPAYREKSQRLRGLMRHAANVRRNRGDKLLFVVEGIDLFGERDSAFFSDELHPNDEGNERLARRLSPVIKRVLFGGDKEDADTSQSTAK